MMNNAEYDPVISSTKNDNVCINDEGRACLSFKRNHQPQHHLIVTIVSAHYGPCEDKRRRTTSLSDEHEDLRCTRDVAPFLRTLLMVQQRYESSSSSFSSPSFEISNNEEKEDDKSTFNGIFFLSSKSVRLSAIAEGGMKRTQIRVLEGGMNSIFGDPCPGISKRLHVDYIISEVVKENGNDSTALTSPRASRAASAEVHHLAFAEHEPVVLRRRVDFYRQHAANISLQDQYPHPQSNSTQSESSMLHNDVVHDVKSTAGIDNEPKLRTASSSEPPQSLPSSVSSSTYEITLPLIMPYLHVKERVYCQLVGQVWRSIIRQWGVATTIDSQDPLFCLSFPTFTRTLLRGLLSHSFTSLQNLFIGGMEDLEKSDLHPSIPHLKRLRSLDVSFCLHLDDETLKLLAEHTKDSLRVLYIKGLRRVTDAGVLALCHHCVQLQVLEVSYIPLTDQAGVQIGSHLTQLQALYMRDNYQLTNTSINAITSNCVHLEQLTLWGCTRLKQLQFVHHPRHHQSSNTNLSLSSFSAQQQLVMLNLWGCHSLTDDSAEAFQGMTHLRSLIVSECHRLTDRFVIATCQYVPHLHHFWLRYCKRVSDVGIQAIARAMSNLFSLDLSFCSGGSGRNNGGVGGGPVRNSNSNNNIGMTANSIAELLLLVPSLSELRLAWCKGLDIIAVDDGDDDGDVGELGQAGQDILRALRREDCRLSVLDVAHCFGGNSNESNALELFAVAMQSLGFAHKPVGYFSRPARWTLNDHNRLAREFCRRDHSDMEMKMDLGLTQ